MRSKSRAKRPNTEPQPSHRGLYQHYRPEADSDAAVSWLLSAMARKNGTSRLEYIDGAAYLISERM